MQRVTNHSWSELFTPSEPGASPVISQTFRVLRKHGEPLLMLPAASSLAAQALALYPAQSSLARIARALLRQALCCGMPVASERAEATIASTGSFAEFLRRLADSKSFPSLAILAGNPRQAGQRFLILVFSPQGRPAAVVKAGLGHTARELILQEASFLKSVPPGTAGIPRLREQFESDRLCALALDFAPGDSPRERDSSAVPDLMIGWLDQGREVGVGDLTAWQDLSKCPSPLFARLETQLRGRRFHPALAHGDFAPWNVKVGPDGRWVVLDWERGQLKGPPAWDWFHYEIQPAILVEKLATNSLVGKLDGFLASPAFQTYAKAAGLSRWEREWMLAYLLYCREVIKPAEGLPETVRLLETLASRWPAN